MMTTDDEVRAVSAAWDEALIANDADAVAGFMTGDWMYVGPDGVTSRSDIVGWIGSGRLRHDSMTMIGQDRVLHAGTAVVLTARKASAGVWDAAPYTADEWISEVWVPTRDGWRCALSQKSPVTFRRGR
jgi:ketosteroid isomerase-like protein